MKNLENNTISVDSIVQSVMDKMISRCQRGRSKYGTDMDRTDLNEVQWLVHAQEEALDLAVYLEKLIQEKTK